MPFIVMVQSEGFQGGESGNVIGIGHHAHLDGVVVVVAVGTILCPEGEL